VAAASFDPGDRVVRGHGATDLPPFPRERLRRPRLVTVGHTVTTQPIGGRRWMGRLGPREGRPVSTVYPLQSRQSHREAGLAAADSASPGGRDCPPGCIPSSGRGLCGIFSRIAGTRVGPGPSLDAEDPRVIAWRTSPRRGHGMGRATPAFGYAGWRPKEEGSKPSTRSVTISGVSIASAQERPELRLLRRSEFIEEWFREIGGTPAGATTGSSASSSGLKGRAACRPTETLGHRDLGSFESGGEARR